MGDDADSTEPVEGEGVRWGGGSSVAPPGSNLSTILRLLYTSALYTGPRLLACSSAISVSNVIIENTSFHSGTSIFVRECRDCGVNFINLIRGFHKFCFFGNGIIGILKET